MWEGYEGYEEYVYIENHPHFCPRKNGDSCRPVSGFHRLKRDLHTCIFIPISPTGLLRLFPCSLRVLFLSFFSLIPCGLCALILLRVSFSSFSPCPFLTVFSSFPIPPGVALPCFLDFPFVSLTHSVRSWRAVWLCVIAFRLFPSRLSSRYSMRGAGRLCLSRGVGLFHGGVLRGWWDVLSFRLAARFPVGAWGGAFWLVFSYGIIGGLFEEELMACLRRDERRRTETSEASEGNAPGFLYSLGAFFSVWIVLCMGCRCLIFSCVA